MYRQVSCGVGVGFEKEGGKSGRRVAVRANSLKRKGYCGEEIGDVHTLQCSDGVSNGDGRRRCVGRGVQAED